MKYWKPVVITAVVFIAVVVGLRVWVSTTTIKLEGPVWNSIEECAENQQKLVSIS